LYHSKKLFLRTAKKGTFRVVFKNSKKKVYYYFLYFIRRTLDTKNATYTLTKHRRMYGMSKDNRKD